MFKQGLNHAKSRNREHGRERGLKQRLNYVKSRNGEAEAGA